MFYALYKYVVIGPALRAVVRVRVNGSANIPRYGPVILASNHLAEIDSLILPLASPRPISFFAKSEYFTGHGLRGRLSRWFFQSARQIPIDRSGRDHAALDAAVDLLRRGGIWGIYPEGTRSPDGRLHRGHTGVVRVAAQVPGVVVIPVGLCGTDAVNPPGTKRTFHRGHVEVHFGEPLDLQGLLEKSDVRGVTDEIMEAIRSLTGQSYEEHYANRP